MIPILYEKDEVHFQHNGLGQLPDVIDSFSHEAGNGFYELQLTYPTVKEIDGYDNAIWKELKLVERQILYKPSHNRKTHAFRIYDYDIDGLDQTITVYARSRAYDLAGNVVKKLSVKNANPQQAMDQMKNNLTEPTDFDFYSDMSTTSSTTWEQQSGLSTIMGEEGSLIQYWGGEVLRENTRISLYNRIGKDNVTTLRIGKNIEELNYNLKTDGMVTAIIPFYRYTPEGEYREEVIVNGNTVKSSKFNNYRLPYYQFVEYTKEDGVTDVATLNKKAASWFKEHPGADEPNLTVTVAMTDVAESTEYSYILRKLETVNVFDTVSVYLNEFDIDMVIKVNSLKYDGVSERNLEVELGTPSSSLFEAVVGNQFESVNKQLDEVRKIGIVAQISADGKNTNYQGSLDPNEAGLVGDNGDIYFRTIGTEKQMWQYQGDQWNLILDTSRLEAVEKEVSAIIAQADADRETAEQNFEQAVVDAVVYTNTKAQEFDTKLLAVNQEVANVTQAANTAVSKADKAIQDVGFMQIDVNAAKTNAIEALTKAQEATENVNVMTTSFDELTQTIGLKADNTTVDNLKNTVDQHSLNISANAQAINARLTSAQVETLLTGKKYVNETTLNATANGIRADITQVSSDLSNLEIGGRNLIKGTQFSTETIKYTQVSAGGEGGFQYTPTETLASDNEYTISIKVRGNTNIVVYMISTSGNLPLSFIDKSELNTTEFRYFSLTFRPHREQLTQIFIYTKYGTTLSGDWFEIARGSLKLEKGNKATDWSPAPEDMATLEKVTSIEANVDGLQTTVASKADKSQITQLSTQISTKVESATYNSKITQLDSSIDLRVTKGDVTAQINVEAGVTLISNKKLLLDADTYIMGITFANDVKAKSLEAVYADIVTLKTKVLTADAITSTMLKSDTALVDKIFATDANVNRLTAKTAFINSVKAIDIAADRITAGTLNAALVNIINLNANSITTGTVSGANSSWNLNSGLMNFTNPSTGDVLEFTQGRIRFQNGAQERLLNYNAEGLQIKAGVANTGTSKNTSLWLIGEGSGSYAYIQFVENNTAATNQRLEAEGGSIRVLTAPGGKFEVRTNGTRALNEILSSASQVTGVSGAFMRMTPGSIETERYGNRSLKLMPTGTGKVEVTDGTYWWNVKAKEFETVSSRKLKTNIEDFEGNALSIINDLNIVTYNMKQELEQGINIKKIGLISEDSPSVASSGGLSIDMYKLNVLTAKAVQELDQKVIAIANVTDASNSLANQALSETQKLKAKVSELEQKIQQLESAA